MKLKFSNSRLEYRIGNSGCWKFRVGSSRSEIQGRKFRVGVQIWTSKVRYVHGGGGRGGCMFTVRRFRRSRLDALGWKFTRVKLIPWVWKFTNWKFKFGCFSSLSSFLVVFFRLLVLFDDVFQCLVGDGFFDEDLSRAMWLPSVQWPRNQATNFRHDLLWPRPHDFGHGQVMAFPKQKRGKRSKGGRTKPWK